MANEVRITVTADDQASGKISQVSQQAGGLGKTLGDVGKIAGGFLAANVIGSGFQKLSGFLGESIAAAKEAMAVEAQLGAVLKSTGGIAGVTADEAKKLASAFQQTTKFDDEATLSAENMLLTFTNIGKQVFPDATKAVLDMATAMGQDLQTTAVQVGKALQDPVEGVGSLQRVGVRLTEQQKEQVEAMVAAGDAAGAQALILKELQTEFGGSAEAAAKADGGMAQMQNRMGDLKEEIGLKLIPVQLKWQEVQLAVLNTLVNDIAPAIKQFSDEYLPKLQKAWADIQPVVQFLFEFTKARIEGLIEVIQSIAAIIDGVVKLVDDLFHGRWAQAWADMKLIASEAVDLLLGYVKLQFGNLPGIAVEAGTEMGKGLANAVASGFKGAWNAIADEINRAIPDKITIPGPFPDIDLPDNPIPKLAMGGTVRSPFQVVGEQGPEIAALPMGTRVFSNAQSRQMLAGGGTTIVNHFHFDGPVMGDQSQANQLVEWILPALRVAIA